jgi:hypothetical protein
MVKIPILNNLLEVNYTKELQRWEKRNYAKKKKMLKKTGVILRYK